MQKMRTIMRFKSFPCEYAIVSTLIIVRPNVRDWLNCTATL